MEPISTNKWHLIMKNKFAISLSLSGSLSVAVSNVILYTFGNLIKLLHPLSRSAYSGPTHAIKMPFT